MRQDLVTIPALLAALFLAGCGGGDTVAPATGGPGTPAATGDAGVPDACTLLTPADLTAALGSEHGTGKPQRVSPDRSTCMYPNGTITAVEIAGNFEFTKGLIENQGRKTQDIPGLGTAAYYDPAGQVIAKGDKVFVAVTAFGADVEKLKAATAKLLEAAE